jgi:hypothetical protein
MFLNGSEQTGKCFQSVGTYGSARDPIGEPPSSTAFGRTRTYVRSRSHILMFPTNGHTSAILVSPLF